MLGDLQIIWQAGGLPLFMLLVIGAWCAGLITRESLALFKGAPSESNLPVLGALASVAPLIGLLGTVVGLVRVFTAGVAAEDVAGGIGQALLTTQVGLLIAIPALVLRQALRRWQEHRMALQLSGEQI